MQPFLAQRGLSPLMHCYQGNNRNITQFTQPFAPQLPHLVARLSTYSGAPCYAAANDNTASSALTQVIEIASGGKVTKSAIAKLPVASLRAACDEAGLPTEGLKPDLVERVLAWALQRQIQSQQDGKTREARRADMGTSPDLQEHMFGKDTNQTSISKDEDSIAGSQPTSPVPGGSMAMTRADKLKLSNTAATTVDASQRDNEPLQSKATTAATIIATMPQDTNAPSETPAEASIPKGKLPHRLPFAPRDIKVTWLGTSSGAPTSRRNVSGIAVRYGDDRVFLVDCGEGTRNQMRVANIDPSLVTHIFITHLHGDHCFGIAGMLRAIAQKRLGTSREQEPIRIYGPPELQRLLFAAISASGLQLSMPVVLTGWVFDPYRSAKPTAVAQSSSSVSSPSSPLLVGFQAPDQAAPHNADRLQALQEAFDQGSDQIVRRGLTWTTYLPEGVKVTAAQLQHRMPCWGYVFQEPHNRSSQIPPSAMQDSSPFSPAPFKGGGKNRGGGEDEEEEQEEEGESRGDTSIELPNEMVVPGRKLVLLGDTCDSWAIAEAAAGCDLLSHEATFNKGMEDKARLATHSTAEQAGHFARAIGAKALVLTHFSARYEQAEKITKTIAQANKQGTTVGSILHKSVASTLQQEARDVSGYAKVYMANDYYTFTVLPRRPMSQKAFEEQEELRLARVRSQAASRSRVEGDDDPQRRSGAYPSNRGTSRGGTSQRGYHGRGQQQRPRNGSVKAEGRSYSSRHQGYGSDAGYSSSEEPRGTDGSAWRGGRRKQYQQQRDVYQQYSRSNGYIGNKEVGGGGGGGESDGRARWQRPRRGEEDQGGDRNRHGYRSDERREGRQPEYVAEGGQDTRRGEGVASSEQ